MGRRVLKFDGLSGRGLWIALWAMLIKSALRDLLSVSYGMISILVTGSLRSPPPYPAVPDFLHGKACHTILRSLCSLTNRVPLPPLCRGQNKTPRSLASSAQRIAKNKVPPAGGKGGGVSHQKGCISSPARAVYGFPTGESPVVQFSRPIGCSLK